MAPIITINLNKGNVDFRVPYCEPCASTRARGARELLSPERQLPYTDGFVCAGRMENKGGKVSSNDERVKKLVRVLDTYTPVFQFQLLSDLRGKLQVPESRSVQKTFGGEIPGNVLDTVQRKLEAREFELMRSYLPTCASLIEAVNKKTDGALIRQFAELCSHQKNGGGKEEVMRALSCFLPAAAITVLTSGGENPAQFVLRRIRSGVLLVSKHPEPTL